MTFSFRNTLLPAFATAVLVATGAQAQPLDAGASPPPAEDAGVALPDADVGTLSPRDAALPEPPPATRPEPVEASGPPPAAGELVQVEVRTRSRADALRRSAAAVSVLELKDAKRASADLGEVLARSEGVVVRRAGGLGSDQRLSLAGLEGEQIRLFLDGMPLELTGYPFGISNVPVNTIDRVDIYRGVVPIELGSDALGGAINLITSVPREGSHGSASYQGGSFDTHRGTAELSYMRDGLFAKAAGFADYGKNDYTIQVEETRPDGSLYTTRVHRTHDAYRAEGANLTLGAVGKPWAERLMLRSFFTQYDKEIQHDVLMNRPYGEATTGGLTGGSSLSFHHLFAERLLVDASAGYTYSVARLHDLTRCVYNWYGVCTPAELRGEIGTPRDTEVTQHALFVRSKVRYEFVEGHTASLSIAPTHFRRGGNDHYEPRPGERDPLDVDRRLSSMVLGLEYALLTLSDTLEATAFGKAYFQWVRSEELLRDGENSVRRDSETKRLGAGTTLRYTIIEPLWFKLSYEYATRLPNVDEVFGDGITIEPNLELRPEVSHNGNVTLAGDCTSGSGRVTGELGGFLRDADRLINLVGIDTFRYTNVQKARSLGTMVTASYAAPGEHLSIGGNATYQAFRNRSTDGDFARFEGARMPSRPYFFANGNVRGQLRGVFGDKDTLSLTFYTRYTHGFFRAWENAGRRETKDRVPHQLVHSLLLTHLVQKRRGVAFSTSLELQNLTNERVFDFFGVEKPGRAVFAKIVAER